MSATDTAAQQAAQRASWDRLWRLLLSPPSDAPTTDQGETVSEREIEPGGQTAE